MNKTAYLWGPVSTFTAPLAAWLLAKGWHIHIATKSALNIFSLSSLDLPSSARDALETVFGARNKFKAFQDRLKLVDPNNIPHDIKYDAVIFCGLPPNFDDARAPRASWAATELPNITKTFKGIPVFIVSSLWAGVQTDGVVPEELEFERRKARNHWEKICQDYELKIIEGLSKLESPWYLVRLPLLTGATANGYSFAFNGLANLFSALDPEQTEEDNNKKIHIPTGGSISLAHEADATLWFLPVDIAVYIFWRYLEDSLRPRICNFVSPRATLNREWLQYLAHALGLKEILPCTKDNLPLPFILKKLLLDNVQVKTRNLFEVAGRYQLKLEKLDESYFGRTIQAGREKNWGKRQTAAQYKSTFSPDIATYYFEEFIPAHLSGELLHKAIQGSTTIGFKLNDAPELAWILKKEQTIKQKNSEEKISVERYRLDSEKPKICFYLSTATMSRLAQNELALHQALLLKEVQADGPLFDTLRVSQALSRFMKEHPLKDERLKEKIGQG